MTINELIDKLNSIKTKIGDTEIVFVSCDGENDIYSLHYPITGDFEDCDGKEYKCAFILDRVGEEFTRKGVPHYKWKPYEDEVTN